MHRPSSFSRCLITLGTGEFQGHHTNQAYYKSGIMSQEYHEIKGADGEF
jgi:hypothetical protein